MGTDQKIDKGIVAKISREYDLTLDWCFICTWQMPDKLSAMLGSAIGDLETIKSTCLAIAKKLNIYAPCSFEIDDNGFITWLQPIN